MRLHLKSFSIAPIQGTTYPSVVVNLANTGTNLCKPALAVALTGPGGVQHETRRLDTVLPGSSIPYPFVWPHSLSAGSYTADITATGCGPRQVLHGTASLGAKLVNSTGPASLTHASGERQHDSVVADRARRVWWDRRRHPVRSPAAGPVLGLRTIRRVATRGHNDTKQGPVAVAIGAVMLSPRRSRWR